jgi:hypothetical protein
MRFALVIIAAFGLLIGSAAAPLTALAATASGHTLVVDQPPAQPPASGGTLEVDIDTDEGAWYTSPVWIAIGIIALVLLIVLIVMATRGGGTTIIRE